MNLKFLLSAVLAFIAILPSKSQDWISLKDSDIPARQEARSIVPDTYRTYRLDIKEMQERLQQVKRNGLGSTAIISIPNAKGLIQSFAIVRRDVFHPDLAAKYPAIQAYTGYNLEDESQVIKLSMSSEGMDAMILGSRGEQTFIDRYHDRDSEHYIVYFKKDYQKLNRHTFTCTVEDPLDGYKPDDGSQRYGDCTLRTYRLAIACTGEYTAFHGGTTERVLAEYNTAMNRVNGIYERDLAITMQIIPQTDTLIFFDPDTDPYTNNSGGAMLGQNQNTVDQLIGSANYDIGHVFSTGGGGIASLRSPCNNNRKARGVTGLGSPINDPFYVDYVAHEMGHQFGGNHSYNNSCNNNRNNGTAVEPGSGATIMAYAGICGPNVQNQSDDYFHTVNLEEIANFVVAGDGDCAVETQLDNNAPEINGVDEDVVIPAGTPFVLTMDAVDVDGDPLTYTWEQMDIEISAMPPEAESEGGPLFRSYDPSLSPVRYFPRLSNILSGTNGNTWEVLPSVSRTMNFRGTVRDNAELGGCTDFDDVTVTVDGDSGPFIVTEPNPNTTWNSGGVGNVIWDVAGTDQEPVNCERVDIYLAINDDRAFDILLATGVPNSGSYDVTVPSVNTTLARVMVKCASNIFFDVNDGDFAIIAPFSTLVEPSEATLCPGDSTDIVINYIANNGFSETVSYTLEDIPAGVTATLSQTEISEDGSINLELIADEAITPGAYNLTLRGLATSGASINVIQLYIAAPENIMLEDISPLSGSRNQDLAVPLSWTAIQGIRNYQVQLSKTASFDDPLFDEIVSSSNFEVAGLETATVYYWRVAPISPCFSQEFLDVYSFQTGTLSCQENIMQDSIAITDEDDNEINSVLQITDTGAADLINVSVTIDHTYVGDLTGNITNPDGIVVNLFDRAGVPASDFGCSRNNINAKFSDIVAASYDDFENTCVSGADYAITGAFQPIEALQVYNGLAVAGDWTLGVTDLFSPDGGMLVSWSLEVCQKAELDEAVILNNEGLSLINTATALVSKSNISVASSLDEQTIFMVKGQPSVGALQKLDAANGGFVTLQVGDVFSQADLDLEQVRYLYQGNGQPADQITFDIVDDQNRWIEDVIFDISIEIGELTASVEILNQLECFADVDGVVQVIGLGGVQPYTYSLDGTTFTEIDIFEDLLGGEYIGYVQDQSGDLVETAFVISEPDEVLVSISVLGPDVTIDAAGGTGIYQYSANGGMVYQNENTFQLENFQSYDILVKDQNDCFSQPNSIEVNFIADFTTTIIDVLCAGDETGSITVTEELGGVGPYLYALSGGNPQADNIFDNLSGGSYEVTVTDAAGIFYSKTLFVNQPAPITVSADTLAGTVEINAVGGTPPYTYQVSGLDAQSENVFESLLNGDYSYTVTDANGCVSGGEFVIATSTVSTTNLKESAVAIYPNPVKDILYLNYDDSIEFNSLTIYNVDGILVEKTARAKSIDTSSLPAGSYILKLEGKDVISSKRFVKVY